MAKRTPATAPAKKLIGPAPPARPARLDAPDRFLRRTVRKRRITLLTLALVLIALIYADRQGWLLHETQEWIRYDGRTVRVVRVVDGDTLDVDIADGGLAYTRVRFWGIDTPETAKPHEGAAAEPLADDAFRFARNLCEGKQVVLRLDFHQFRDRYDRLLAYIELPGGDVLNELLLLEGLARYEPRFPHRHLERYELLERQAKFEKKGLWRSDAARRN